MIIQDNVTLVNIIKNSASIYLDNEKRDEKVLNAMLQVDRKFFLPNNVKDIAYEDRPLPIGFNQTCSQPSMVAFMLDKLQIKQGNNILEIGAGCGYASAIASILCKPGGTVFASEIIQELTEIMRMNLAGYIENIVILPQDGSGGFKEYSPFDRIFISAGIASSKFDKNILINQLSSNGILLYPETYGNIYVIKKQKDKIETDTFYGVSFVPLRGKNA